MAATLLGLIRVAGAVSSVMVQWFRPPREQHFLGLGLNCQRRAARCFYVVKLSKNHYRYTNMRTMLVKSS